VSGGLGKHLLLGDGAVQVGAHYETLSPRVLADLKLSALCNNFDTHRFSKIKELKNVIIIGL
jgi:hypothetical protein